MAVIAALVLARGFRGNDHGFARLQKWLDHPVMRVTSLVSNHHIHFGVLEQHIRAIKVMGLSGREVKAGWIAQRIDRGVDLGRQAAATSPDGLALFRPPFLAPALCWWALTMVESIQFNAVFIVCTLHQGFEDALPDTRSALTRVAKMHHPKVAKALQASRAKECLPGIGTAPTRQTTCCPEPSCLHDLRIQATSP